MRRKKKFHDYNLTYNHLHIFEKTLPSLSSLHVKIRCFTFPESQKLTQNSCCHSWLTSEAISSCSHILKPISALLSPSKAAQHCKISLTVIKQLISFYLILKSNKMLLAGGSFNASLLAALTRCLLIVTVKAKRLTRLGWDAAACQVFSLWLMEQSQVKLSVFSH